MPQLMPLIILRPMLPISRAFPSLNLETGRQWLTVVDSFRQGRQCDCVESGRQFSTVVDSGRQWLTEGSFRQLRQWSTVVDSSTVRSTASTVSTVRAQELAFRVWVAIWERCEGRRSGRAIKNVFLEMARYCIAIGKSLAAPSGYGTLANRTAVSLAIAFYSILLPRAETLVTFARRWS